MNKYPYIARAKKSGSVCVVFDYGKCVCVESKDSNFEFGEAYNVDESVLFNITAEYLANTKVKIKSEEHAEFIIKLFNNAFDIGAVSRNPKWIYNKGEAGVTQQFHGEPSGELKLITIPLPPKEESMSKEWPQVGDEALTNSLEKVEVLALDNGVAWVKHLAGDSSFGYLSVEAKYLSKPPTPEEELTSALLEYTNSDNYSCEWKGFAKSIINGEIKGLSYKPE